MGNTGRARRSNGTRFEQASFKDRWRPGRKAHSPAVARSLSGLATSPTTARQPWELRHHLEDPLRGVHENPPGTAGTSSPFTGSHHSSLRITRPCAVWSCWALRCARFTPVRPCRGSDRAPDVDGVALGDPPCEQRTPPAHRRSLPPAWRATEATLLGATRLCRRDQAHPQRARGRRLAHPPDATLSRLGKERPLLLTRLPLRRADGHVPRCTGLTVRQQHVHQASGSDAARANSRSDPHEPHASVASHSNSYVLGDGIRRCSPRRSA